MITTIIIAVSSALVYFLCWLVYEYISYRRYFKEELKIRQHLLDYPLSDYQGIEFLKSDSEDYDEYLQHDIDYYRNHPELIRIVAFDEEYLQQLKKLSYEEQGDSEDESYHHNFLQNIYDNMLEEAMIQDIENDTLEDEYYHHDEDYYRTHSAFVIIEKDENESMNQ